MRAPEILAVSSWRGALDAVRTSFVAHLPLRPVAEYRANTSCLKSLIEYACVSLIWKTVWPPMKAARRVSDCLPEPPTPTSSALPRGSEMMREMREPARVTAALWWSFAATYAIYLVTGVSVVVAWGDDVDHIQSGGGDVVRNEKRIPLALIGWVVVGMVRVCVVEVGAVGEMGEVGKD